MFIDYILLPKIAADTLKMHPATIFLSVIVGGTLASGVGAIIAIPIAATIQSILSTYADRHEINHDHHLLLEPIKREKKSRAKFNARSTQLKKSQLSNKSKPTKAEENIKPKLESKKTTPKNSKNN